MFNKSLQINSEVIVRNSSSCSCVDCDSSTCFLIRRNRIKCCCHKCDSQTTCLFYTDKMSTVVKKSSNIKIGDEDDLKKEKNSSKNVLNVEETAVKDNSPLPETNKIPEQFGSNEAHLPEKGKKEQPCAHLPEKIKKEQTCPNLPEKTKKEQTSAYLPEKKESPCVPNKRILTQDPFVTNETFQTEVIFDEETKTKLKVEKHSKFSIQRNAPPRTDGTFEILNKENNIGLEMISHNVCSPTAKLSAQIMNMPYVDFKNTISFHSQKSSIKAKTNLTKIDILNRIKEAYKACSCKVCECIDNMTLNLPANSKSDNPCDCKPCECDDCLVFKTSHYKTCIESAENTKKCLCLRCIKEKHTSDIERNIRSIYKSCDCEPCQCIQCKRIPVGKHRTMIVAPVGEDRQTVCQCAPCDCLECGHVYGRITTSLTHEIATGINRHRNCRCETCFNENCDRESLDVCRCDPSHDKVMRKPVQRDSNDYDIRRAIISECRSNNRINSKCIEKNTLAMYAAVKKSQKLSECSNHSNYNNRDFESTAMELQYKSSLQSTKPKKVFKSTDILNRSKCEPCDCKYCTSTCERRDVNGQTNTLAVLGNIRCESENSCIVQGNNIFRPVMSFPLENVCKCEPCECITCTNFDKTEKHTCIYNFPCSLEKGLNKSSCLMKNGNIRLGDPTLQSNYGKFRKIFQNKSQQSFTSLYSTQDIMMCPVIPKNTYINSSGRSPLRLKIDSPSENNSKNKIAIHNSARDIKKCHYPGNMSIQVSESYLLPAFSNGEFFNRKSYAFGQNLIKSSRQSSCNSSGHDHSDYLIRFPRTPAETYINEVMNCKLEEKCYPDGSNKALNKDQIPEKNILKRSADPSQHELSLRKKLCCDFDVTDANTKKFENWYESVDCKCDKCDCDKCSFKKMKMNRCQCDCYTCQCYGACLSQDRSVCIRKNEGTQTVLHKIEKINKSEQHNSVMCPNMLVFDSNYTCDTNALLENNTCCPWNYVCHLPHSDCINLPVHIDYGSVHNTLQEARQFSAKLMEILENYEKANREFQSLSDETKSTNVSYKTDIPEVTYDNKPPLDKMKNIDKSFQVDLDVTSITDIHNVSNNILKVPTIGNKKYCQDDIELLGIKTISSYILNEVTKKILGDSKDMLLMKKYKKYSKLIKKALKLARPKEFKSKLASYIDIGKTESEKVVADTGNISKLYNVDSQENSTSKPEKVLREHGIKNSIAAYRITNIENSERKSEEPHSSSTYKLSIDNSEERCEEARNSGVHAKVAEQDQQDLVDVMNHLAEVFGDEVEMNARNVITDSNGRKLHTNSRQGEEFQQFIKYDELPVQNKDYTPPVTMNKGIAIYPLLTSHVRETSTHTFQSIEVYRTQQNQGNKALANLQVQVKNLLDMPQLQTGINISYVSEENTVSSVEEYRNKQSDKAIFCSMGDFSLEQLETHLCEIMNDSVERVFKKSSAMESERCDYEKPSKVYLPETKLVPADLKIKFHSIRRVSDHTIVVKWNPPKFTEDIQGYELQIDGRSVKKILSPSRCIAVVTCLSHTEKVLLSIKSITKTVPEFGVYPTTTILYHPRVKNETLLLHCL